MVKDQVGNRNFTPEDMIFAQGLVIEQAIGIDFLHNHKTLFPIDQKHLMVITITECPNF